MISLTPPPPYRHRFRESWRLRLRPSAETSYSMSEFSPSCRKVVLERYGPPHITRPTRKQPPQPKRMGPGTPDPPIPAAETFITPAASSLSATSSPYAALVSLATARCCLTTATLYSAIAFSGPLALPPSPNVWFHAPQFAWLSLSPRLLLFLRRLMLRQYCVGGEETSRCNPL